MDQLAEHIRQITDLVNQHVPAQNLPPILPTAIVSLLFGASICALGAMLARWFIAVVFAAGGIAAGLGISRSAAVSPAPCALGGGLVGGAVGFVLHRLWVGMMAGAFLAAVAVAIFSSQKVVPHLLEFDQSHVGRVAEGFQLPEPGDATAVVDLDHLTDYLDEFGRYVSKKDPNMRLFGGLVVVGAGLVGLLMGIFLCRFTLILFTAVLGTFLIGAGFAMLGQVMEIGVSQAYRDQPEVTLGALAACFVVSVVLQTFLTRPAVAPVKKSAK